MIYKHRNTGNKMTIIKLFGSVARCKLENPRQFKMQNSIWSIDTCVCRLDNLVKCEGYEQKQLF